MRCLTNNCYSKNIVMMVSSIFFSIQCKHAVESFISPKIIDATVIKDIKEINPPVITVCPTNQLNKTALMKLGYYDDGNDLSTVLIGIDKNSTSWGSSNNLSYSQVLEQVTKREAIVWFFNPLNIVQPEIVIIPKFSFCKSFSNYDPNLEIIITSQYSFRLFITDQKYSSYIHPDFRSMKGNAILAHPGKVYFIDVLVSVMKVCNKPQFESFSACVDEWIQKSFISSIGCVPPWLSDQNQCNGIYLQNFTDLVSNYGTNYVWAALSLLNLHEERKCKKLFCTFTSIETRLRDIEEDGPIRLRTRVHLSFQTEVSVTEKIPDYNFFKLVIDIGSSLGLWLGLSILGLWDLWLETIMWVRSSKILKWL